MIDWQKAITSVFSGVLAVLLVGAYVYQTVVEGRPGDAQLAALAGAAVATYLTGGAIRQVNGTAVASLTQAVLGVHARLDAAGIGPARDGSAPAAAAVDQAGPPA